MPDMAIALWFKDFQDSLTAGMILTVLLVIVWDAYIAKRRA